MITSQLADKAAEVVAEAGESAPRRSRPRFPRLEPLGGILVILQILVLTAQGLKVIDWGWWMLLAPAMLFVLAAVVFAIAGFVMVARDGKP